jgi:hypothetical protein
MIQPKRPDAWDSLGSVNPDKAVGRVASLETIFEAPEFTDGHSEPTTFTEGRAFFDTGGSSFDERFASAFEFPGSRQVEEQERANSIPLGSPDLGRPAASRHVVAQFVPGIPLPTAKPVNLSKKQLRLAEAPVATAQMVACRRLPVPECEITRPIQAQVRISSKTRRNGGVGARHMVR